MSHYRRSKHGVLFFLTWVTHNRRDIFSHSSARDLLRNAIEATRRDHPWETEAIVLLPDHLHMLWRLPETDNDYSRRMGVIKKRFTRAYLASGGAEGEVSASQKRQGNRGIWQKRFWEHSIRDARDFYMHIDYIHANPVKHGHVEFARDWPHSSFHRYIELGWYESDWAGRIDLPGTVEYLSVD